MWSCSESSRRYSYQELSITIDSLLEKNKNTNLAFYILTIGSLMLSGCDDRNEKRIAAVAQASQQPVKADNETRPQSCAKDSVLVRETEETMLVGMMTVVPEDENTDEPRTFVMQMPEFKGGMEALNHFIQSNLKYPEWERKNGIEGNVFVSFVIERSGKISDAKIIKSVAGSRGFDAEVLSVISKMPPWTPGVDYGRKVAVRYVLPMKFAL
ncbi:energy transducer TonB [Chryseolinea lacunae]|uniref:Energy transducer TonB n=1 Tax=Chryseolinea lacunae TaxID=2801331 RepID=A0ABS1L133_9BACT|nr:energy transducer TonB [Chryseolinea lacunae]MBL0745413.1 energy transducer TonB [Chryseolinea lacunae]